MQTITYVGLDVHKATISVAVAEGRRGGEVRQVGVFPNRPEQIAKLVDRLGKGGRPLSFCYEAGPCGYGLHRQLSELGHDCIVVAPSLIPIKAGCLAFQRAKLRSSLSAFASYNAPMEFSSFPRTEQNRAELIRDL